MLARRPLGATGLEISEIVFGAGAVGGAVFRPAREERREIVARALALGVQWIDTAPSYGNGQSEENLGWILEELEAEPHISTKVRIDPADPDIVGQIERSLRASLTRLRRSRVDLVQLHNAIAPEPSSYALGLEQVLGPKGVAEGLDRVRELGLTDHLGFTGFGDTRCLHEVIASDRFQTVQVYYNLLNPSAGRSLPPGFPGQDFERLIDAAASRGLGVLGIRALSAGALVGPDAAHPISRLTPGSSAEADARHAARLLRELGLDRAEERADAAVRFALGHAGVSGVAIGFSERSHVEVAVRAAEAGSLDQGAIATIDGLHARAFRHDGAPEP